MTLQTLRDFLDFVNLFTGTFYVLTSAGCWWDQYHKTHSPAGEKRG